MTTAERDRQRERERALAWANDVRTLRARLKLDISDLPADESASLAAEIVGRDVYDAWLRTMEVDDLLKAVRRWGDDRARRALVRAGVKRKAALRDLTPRQRAKLVEELTL